MKQDHYSIQNTVRCDRRVCLPRKTTVKYLQISLSIPLGGTRWGCHEFVDTFYGESIIYCRNNGTELA